MNENIIPPDLNPSDPEVREKVDPTEKNTPLPWFLIMLLGALTFWGVTNIFDTPSGNLTEYGDQRTLDSLRPKIASVNSKVDGKQIYSAKCVGCHQGTGLGVAGVFPPLAASEWVTGDEIVLTHILLHGIVGEIEVKGNIYKGAMPAWNALSDDELSGVLTYIRSDWGNSAPPITSATVKEQRDATKDRTEPYNGSKELLETK